MVTSKCSSQNITDLKNGQIRGWLIKLPLVFVSYARRNHHQTQTAFSVAAPLFVLFLTPFTKKKVSQSHLLFQDSFTICTIAEKVMIYSFLPL